MEPWERFRKVMNGEKGIRPLFVHNFGPLPETLERWKEEGGFKTADEWFWRVGFEGEPDKQIGNWIQINGFISPPFAETILEENERTRVIIDQFGVKKKVMKGPASVPQFLDWPVKDEVSWRLIEDRLSPDAPERFPQDWDVQKNALKNSPLPNFLGGLPCGFFGGPRELLGVERLLMWFYDYPETMRSILKKLVELWSVLWAKVIKETRVDFIFIWEDMCYRNGPLISPETFKEFILPCYQGLIGRLKKLGIEHFFVDTDGNCEKLIPLFIEGGVSGMLPFEINSGIDLLKVRERYPDLGIIGGIDKTVFSRGDRPVKRELEKVKEMLRYGRYIPTFDHTIPPDVSWLEYRNFCLRLKEIIYSAGI